MLTMGDEVLRSQGGNNNAYGQDNELSWFDWTAPERESGMLQFTSRLIAARRQAPGAAGPAGRRHAGRAAAHGAGSTGTASKLGQPDRSDDSRSLAFTVRGRGLALHVIANAYWEALEFELPPVDGGQTDWQRIVDTTLPSPDDIVEGRGAPVVDTASYRAGPRSVVVLAAAPAARRSRAAQATPDEAPAADPAPSQPATPAPPDPATDPTETTT